jgi:hypothetical protein
MSKLSATWLSDPLGRIMSAYFLACVEVTKEVEQKQEEQVGS